MDGIAPKMFLVVHHPGFVVKIKNGRRVVVRGNSLAAQGSVTPTVAEHCRGVIGDAIFLLMETASWSARLSATVHPITGSIGRISEPPVVLCALKISVVR
jgi:hypothetical protein